MEEEGIHNALLLKLPRPTRHNRLSDWGLHAVAACVCACMRVRGVRRARDADLQTRVTSGQGGRHTPHQGCLALLVCDIDLHTSSPKHDGHHIHKTIARRPVQWCMPRLRARSTHTRQENRCTHGGHSRIGKIGKNRILAPSHANDLPRHSENTRTRTVLIFNTEARWQAKQKTGGTGVPRFVC